MQSVLNEETVLETFLDTMNTLLKTANNLRDKTGKKNQYYIGGSISRYTKNLTMSFPVLVDNGLSVETAQMISKANEKNIASMLEMLFATMSINGKDGMSGKDVIGKFHHNIDNMSVDDYLDYANGFMSNYKEAAYLPSITPAQIRDIQHEMCLELKKTKKSFPVNSFNEKSLNDYMCKEGYNGVRVFEHVIHEDFNDDKLDLERDKLDQQKFRDYSGYVDTNGNPYNQWQMDYHRQGERDKVSDKQFGMNYGYRKSKDNRDYEYRKQQDELNRKQQKKEFKYRQQQDELNRQRQADEFEYRKAQDKLNYQQRKDEFDQRKYMDAYKIDRDKELDNRRSSVTTVDRSDLRDINNLNQHRIIDSDFKKANELQPTMMIVNFNILDDSGQNVIDRKSFVAGVKCRMIATSTMDIVERLLSTNKTQVNFKNLIRATTGEISLGKDFIMAVDQQKLDAMNDVKKGDNAKLWSTLKKRSVKNTSRKIMRNGNDASSITTLVVSQDAVNYMISEAKFDINQPKNAMMIMDRYNLLCLVIADETNEVAKFLYDGNSEYESISYLVLGREAKDREMRRATELLMKGR